MKKIAFILVIFTVKYTVAQNLTDFIPSNTQYIVGINLGQLDAKSNQMDYAKFLKPLIKNPYNYWSNEDVCNTLSLQDIFKTPKDYGLNINENMYYYPAAIDKISGNMYLFKLADAKLFESKLYTACSNTSDILINYVGNAKIFNTKNMSVSINEQVVMVFVKNYNYYDDYAESRVEPIYEEAAIEPTPSMPVEEAVVDTIAYGDMPMATPPPPPVTEEYYGEYDDVQIAAKEAEEAATIDGDENYDMPEVPAKPKNTKQPKAKPLTAKQKAEIAKQEAIEAREMAIQDSIYMAEQEIERAERKREEDERKKEKLQQLSSIMEQFIVKNADNISSNRNLQYLLNQKNDAFAFYIGGNYLLNSYAQLSKIMHWNITNVEVSTPLLNDVSNTVALNFNQGKVDITMKNLYSNTTSNYMKAIHSNKFNKNLLKYIDGKNLLGFMSLNSNVEASAKYYGEVYKELLNSISSYPKNDYYSNYVNNILPSVELAYAFIDKEMLLKTFTGQAIIACTGFDEIKTKYTTYDYDDNFERQEVIKERIETQPKMVMAMAVGEYENVLKLFNIIKKYKFINQLKDNVIAFYGPKYSHLNVYVALTKDALIITNDANLVNNNLEGFKGDNAIAKTLQKEMKAHNLYSKVYTNNLLQQIKANYMKGDAPSEFNEMLAQLGDMEIIDTKPTDTDYTVNASMKLNNQSENALEIILKMMQRL